MKELLGVGVLLAALFIGTILVRPLESTIEVSASTDGDIRPEATVLVFVPLPWTMERAITNAGEVGRCR